AVDDNGVGCPLEAEAVREREPRVERDGVGDLLLENEALRVHGGVLDVDRQDLDTARAVARRDTRQRRRLFHARLAPRRLEAEDQDLLSDQIARVEHALTAEEAHREARCRWRGGERRDDAQQEQEGRQGARDHEGIIARVNDLEHELRKVVAGDVRFDPVSRLLYSTDASMYQVEPIGVVMPRDADDVQAAVEVARRHEVALLPRGGGTSLTRQTVNRALVLDGQIYREVGRIRDAYAAEVRARYPHHWRRVAGYNLNELVGVGVKPGSLAGGGGDGSDGGGVSSDPPGAARGLNMARLIVGSEGTLVTIVETKVRLVRRPRTTALDVIHFRDLQEALESSQSILETGPYAVELTDKLILDLARGNIEQAQRMGFRSEEHTSEL